MNRQRTTKRASYREGVEWIALNDNAGDDDPEKCGTDGEAQREMIGNIAGYISTLLLADLFGADPAMVAHDIFRKRAQAAEKVRLGFLSGELIGRWHRDA